MSVATRAEGFTWEYLQQLPDDGLRRELVHGQLLVTPSPRLRHQRAVGTLYRMLFEGCPEHLEVVVAPFDWYLAEDTVFVPDLMVVERVVEDRARQESLPRLVVEVQSPSTASTDRTLKRHEYEQAGVPDYWLVDPAAPAMTVLRLAGGAYRQVATATGDEQLTLDAPWPLTLCPAELSRP